jgi:hypothetical protein
MIVSKEYPVIMWWSAGVTSAVAAKICIDWFGKENVRIVFLSTKNEDDSSYTFLTQCENWYETKIEILENKKYDSIQDVWYRFNSLNVASGAICSSELKRDVRRVFTTANKFSYQAFGFDCDEIKRAKGMAKNNPDINPVFPLLALMLSKKDCIEIIQSANSLFLQIEIPKPYLLGFENNNCFKTGCVQGGIGYWQKIQRDFPYKFDAMAKVEHDLTKRKGLPVTILKNSKGLIFLKQNPDYPELQDISKCEGREPKPLLECNGFCGSNDIIKNETENEINYQCD